MRKPEIQENYPHTVGYFQHSSGRGKDWTPKYLEITKVADLQDFFKFLRKLKL